LIWYAVKRNTVEISESPPELNTARSHRVDLSEDYKIANDIKFEHLTVDQGLSENSIHCIIQDHLGYMWFGTQNGLSKNDGYNFTVFRDDVRNTNSLSDNYVTALYEDGADNIWIGTGDGGLNEYDPVSRTFTRYRYDKDNTNSITNDHILKIIGDGDHGLWVSTSVGLNRFDMKTRRFTRYMHDDNNPNSICSDSTSVLFKDRSGTFWIG